MLHQQQPDCFEARATSSGELLYVIELVSIHARAVKRARLRAANLNVGKRSFVELREPDSANRHGQAIDTFNRKFHRSLNDLRGARTSSDADIHYRFAHPS